MALAARLELRQGQGLVITPQLQQAIKQLQLSSVELRPMSRPSSSAIRCCNATKARPRRTSAGRRTVPPRRPCPTTVTFEPSDSAKAADMDAADGDLYGDASPGERHSGEQGEAAQAADVGGAVDWSKAGSGGSFDGLDELEGTLSRAKTLTEHLQDQAALAGFDHAQSAVAAVLIDSVDEGGYLRADLQDIAERLGCPPAQVEAVLARLQGFEPTGVFARDVRECLMLQLKERDRFDPAMAALIDDLELLARRDMAGLRRACAVDEEDLREMMAELRALTPRPGAAFGGEPVSPVAPDVYVREGQGGLWRVELNSDALPKLLVDQRYHAIVSGGARTEAEKTFLSDCMASASWLIRSLDQRAKTILKVASEIVRQQDGFLAFGVEHLRPLNLKTVADAIGMHEIHRKPGDLQQVHGHAARGVRDEVLLHLRHRLLGGRGGPLRRKRAPQDQAVDRRRARGRRGPVGRPDRGHPQGSRRGHRPPNRRQVPRGDAHSLIG